MKLIYGMLSYSCRFIVCIVNHAIQIDPGGDRQLSFIVAYPSPGTLVTIVYKHTPTPLLTALSVASESRSQAFFGSHIFSFLHVFAEGHRALYTTTRPRDRPHRAQQFIFVRLTVPEICASWYFRARTW